MEVDHMLVRMYKAREAGIVRVVRDNVSGRAVVRLPLLQLRPLAIDLRGRWVRINCWIGGCGGLIAVVRRTGDRCCLYQFLELPVARAFVSGGNIGVIFPTISSNILAAELYIDAHEVTLAGNTRKTTCSPATAACFWKA
jgi:hypothetical protein